MNHAKARARSRNQPLGGTGDRGGRNSKGARASSEPNPGHGVTEAVVPRGMDRTHARSMSGSDPSEGTQPYGDVGRPCAGESAAEDAGEGSGQGMGY